MLNQIIFFNLKKLKLITQFLQFYSLKQIK